MGQGFTSQAARNRFCGGTLFLVLLFAALILDTKARVPAPLQAPPKRRRWCWFSG